VTHRKIAPYLPVSTIDRARAVVAALHDVDPAARSLNELIDCALRRECARLERAHNGGQEFPHAGRMPGSGGRR
jgi:hypothetical protein